MSLIKIISRLFIVLLLMLPLCLPPSRSAAQSGALIPSSVKDEPDPSILSLQVMNVDVLIDNQHARVKVLQIFDNHVSQILEGKYLFALPPLASISDFAIWDADTRIPGVMIEKRRANAIYGELKQPKVDPGLLQQDDEHEGRSAFSAKVFPIPAYGTKRVELEYTEMLPVEGLASHFTFPLKASFGDPSRVGEFNLHVHILSDYPISAPALVSNAYALQATKAGPNEYEADFHARDIELKDDFSFDYRINVSESALSWIAYRAPEQISAYDLRDPSLAARNPDGYFEARAIFNQQRRSPGVDEKSRGNAKPRNVVLLLDTSLSMYGEKLTRAVEAVDYFLHSLGEQDQFNLVLFNQEPAPLSSSPLAATPEHVEQALDFIKGSSLAGGTNLRKGLAKALELAHTLPTGERSIVLISDANPTLGTRSIKQLVQEFDKESRETAGPPVRFFAFALGTDANRTLLEELTKVGHGYFAQARETEDISSQLKIFFDQIGSQSIEGLRLTSDQEANFYQVYATHPNSFDGSSVAFVGRYQKPAPQARISVLGQYGTEPLSLSSEVTLPEFEDTHEHLPRVWARARVDALLHEMDLSGEREDYISEIIRLSEKYKFVTPYTAFLAAPRALLRPRLIQPGDPVLRVHTDESIKSVFAVLPFGETLPLKFLKDEKVWEVRFFAPSWMPDGTYRCRLLMTDKDGQGYQEEKSFVVDSHAPRLKASVAAQTVRAGDELSIRVAADSDTARLVARMYGAQPVQLFWSGKEQANTGSLRVPAGLAAGRYTLFISAEDFAHNQSSIELQIEILGHS
jgi:Ca-activated chloride channel family protein